MNRFATCLRKFHLHSEPEHFFCQLQLWATLSRHPGNEPWLLGAEVRMHESAALPAAGTGGCDSLRIGCAESIKRTGPGRCSSWKRHCWPGVAEPAPRVALWMMPEAAQWLSSSPNFEAVNEVQLSPGQKLHFLPWRNPSCETLGAVGRTQNKVSIPGDSYNILYLQICK